MVAVAILGILSAFALPSWNAFTERRQVASINEKALAAIRLTQTKSIQERKSYTIDFRESGQEVQYGMYTSGNVPGWESIGTGGLDTETDFTSLTFNFDGSLEMPAHADDFATLAFSIDGNHLRCVQVMTLLGTLRLTNGQFCIP